MSTKSAEKTPKSTKKALTDDAEGDSGKSGPTRLNNDDKFEFLISCIRHSVNGKVDFDQVAADCGIVSKGAAAKRYERMMKAYGIHATSTPASPREVDLKSKPRAKSNKSRAAASKDATPSKKPASAPFKDMDTTPSKVSPTKKRKMDEMGDLEANDLDMDSYYQAMKDEPHPSIETDVKDEELLGYSPYGVDGIKEEAAKPVKMEDVTVPTGFTPINDIKSEEIA